MRLLDCDYPCDASGAVIVTTEDRAGDWRKAPVFVESVAVAAIDTTSWEYLENILEGALVPCAKALWSRTDLSPSDVDCAHLYDGFSVFTLCWLEALGFCGPGEAGSFIADGHTGLGGSLPMNTDGGVCNVGRHHGSSHCIEAVQQLRGECGERQVSSAEVAMFHRRPRFVRPCCTADGQLMEQPPRTSGFSSSPDTRSIDPSSSGRAPIGGSYWYSSVKPVSNTFTHLARSAGSVCRRTLLRPRCRVGLRFTPGR